MSIVAREAVVTESEVASNVYFLISGSEWLCVHVRSVAINRTVCARDARRDAVSTGEGDVRVEQWQLLRRFVGFGILFEVNIDVGLRSVTVGAEVPILWPVKEPMTVVSSCDSQLYIISKDDFLSVSTVGSRAVLLSECCAHVRV